MQNPFDAGYYGSEELREFGFKHIGNDVLVAKNCTIVGLKNISIGDHSRIDGFCTIIAAQGKLAIGRFVHIHTSNVIGCAGGVELGDFTATSHACHLLSGSDDFSGNHMTGSVVPRFCRKPVVAPIQIGRHVAIGTHCTVMPGVTIGDGAAIGAHSMISIDVREWSITSGAPARFLKSRAMRLLELERSIDSGAPVA